MLSELKCIWNGCFELQSTLISVPNLSFDSTASHVKIEQCLYFFHRKFCILFDYSYYYWDNLMTVLLETERCNVIKSNGRFVDEMKIRHPFQSAPYLKR